jgi:predicted permease
VSAASGGPLFPPRLARRLLELTLPADVRDGVAGDLGEVFARKVRAVGPMRARLWYLREAVAISARLGGRGPSRPGKARRTSGVSWLDVRLGLRMLARNPGLTAVVVFALGVGIPASLLPSHIAHVSENPDLPFEDGDRIVSLVHWNRARGREDETWLVDFERWREGLRSVEDVSAARLAPFNLIAGGSAAPTRGAEISASAFDLVQVPPLLGRPLVPADQLPGAPDVAVIGYEVWSARLGGDPAVVGRTVRVAGKPTTIVGVMPEGFYFPHDEQLWLPLRAGGLDAAARQRLDAWIFGRLAAGASRGGAQAELARLGVRAARELPETHADLLPEVMPFSALAINLPRGSERFEIAAVQIVILVLLGITLGNVVILLMARAATRSSEITVRMALGAGRARIVSQFFVESLLLALLSTGAGLAVADVVATWFQSADFGPRKPFWLDFGVDARLSALALGLAVVSAVAAGVIPALRATAGLGRGLRDTGSGGSGVRFGRLASALIVFEVALGVGCLFASGLGIRVLMPERAVVEGTIRAQEFLSARIVVPAPEPTPMVIRVPPGGTPPSRPPAHVARIAKVHRELKRRLEADPAVRAVAIGAALPGTFSSGELVLADEQDRPAGSRGRWVASTRVDVGFFAAIDVPLRAGRDFVPSDLANGADGTPSAAIVNVAFVEELLRGANPIGRTIRFAPDAPPVEIVGLVGRVSTQGVVLEGDMPGLWLPAAPGEIPWMSVAVRLGNDPAAFIPRLRDVVAGVDPSALVNATVPLDRVVSPDVEVVRWSVRLVAAVSLIAIVLSTAGLYALVSVSVSRRTREIGIRTALGGRPAAIVSVVAKRTLVQLVLGVALGAASGAAVVLGPAADERLARDWQPLLAAAVATVLLVGVGACLRPTLRALRIRPVDALRAED